MATLIRGPVIYGMIPASQLKCEPARAVTLCRSWLWGTKLHLYLSSRDTLQWGPRCLMIRSSSIGGDGSSGEAAYEKDEDYVNSSILEAVGVKSGSDGFLIRMRDGQYIECVHNNPDGTRLPDYPPQPAIVLKMEDGSDLLLPIIVSELPCTMLMEAVRNLHIARPTIYQVLKEMINLMGYKVKMVRITKRVQEAYYAQLYLSKPVGDEVKELSLDLRPSDAINIAARCQAPIQVNRQLAYGDGVKIVSDPTRILSRSERLGGVTVLTELDRPKTDTSLEAEEFVLVRSMLMAAAEERYMDAARIRDELRELRSRKRN